MYMLASDQGMTAGRPRPAARDDARAFDQAFDAHWSGVYRALYRLLGDPDTAEDLAVETFCRLWQRPPRQDDNLGGWLHRVALNLGYNALRSDRRRRRHEDRAATAAAAGAPGTGNPPPAGDPAAAAEAVDVAEHVRTVLARLPERDARMLLLRHAGLSYREIADAVGVAPGSVGTLLARAERAFVGRLPEDVRAARARD